LLLPVVHLHDRALIAVAGEDAETFLQNIITTDLTSLGKGEARAAALLSPQGKILFDFLISRAADTRFVLDCRTALADDFVRRLTLYKLRARATISKQDQAPVAVWWGAESGTSETDSGGLRDCRFPGTARVFRRYALPLPTETASEAEWQALRIEYGVADSGFDYMAGDAFPHDVLLDENGGIGFRKGCYIGQEVVSRMHHRGTARRRVLIASAPTGVPASGTEILANGRPIGTLGTVVGGSGLAIVRIDRVKEAVDLGQPITAGGTPLTLRIPPFAKFGFLQQTAAAEEA
jgi:tRNA-modifying protein YgfZ